MKSITAVKKSVASKGKVLKDGAKAKQVLKDNAKVKKVATVIAKAKAAKASVTDINVKVSSRAIRELLRPLCVLQATEKVGKTRLLVQDRVYACHGKMVKDVVNSIIVGARYKWPDLTYDVKRGRLAVLAPNSSVGPAPIPQGRNVAPLAGQPLPPASLEEFFNFLQGQLKMEIKEHTGKDVELHSKDAQSMWPSIQAFVEPNLGKNERWVPYHTVLGVHELFVVESIHSSKAWDERQRFVAMFVFRAHCKCDLFQEVQAPLMSKAAFWKDPMGAFAPDGVMEKAIYDYRAKTGNPLLTSCFRIIPERLLKDDTRNLIRSITQRTQRLIAVAERAFPVVKDGKRTAAQKMMGISTMLQEERGLGETWAKMLTVCIDLAYPQEGLLHSQCDVGAGAVTPMRCLLPSGGPSDKKNALQELLKIVNGSKNDAAKQFRKVLEASESILRVHFKRLPLVHAQCSTTGGKLEAVTLQVQLCEYRQFRHSQARLQYGLPDDESMRGEPEGEGGMRIADDCVVFDEKRKVMWCEHRDAEITCIPFEVPIKLLGGNVNVARRAAAICLRLLRHGESKEMVLKFRDELAKTYRVAEDVPDGSEAWRACRVCVSMEHIGKNLLDFAGGGGSHAVGFDFVGKDGKKFAFQTTTKAAGGIFEAERIARLCWQRLSNGDSKEVALEYRSELYKQGSDTGRAGDLPAKRART